MTLLMKQDNNSHLMVHFSLEEIAQLCKLTHDEILELLEYKTISPAYKVNGEYFFTTETLNLLVLACKQRNDYDMEFFSVVINYQYLERIEELQNKIQTLHALSKF